jgi:antitoxin VapB
MALYIRDDEVDALARELQKALKSQSKTEAVRTALQNELERARSAEPLEMRIRRLQDAVKAMGPDDPDLDMKEFMDEMWDNI